MVFGTKLLDRLPDQGNFTLHKHEISPLNLPLAAYSPFHSVIGLLSYQLYIMAGLHFTYSVGFENIL